MMKVLPEGVESTDVERLLLALASLYWATNENSMRRDMCSNNLSGRMHTTSAFTVSSD